MRTPKALAVLATILISGSAGCTQGKPKEDAQAAPAATETAEVEKTHGLTAEEAKLVLAKVGDTEITLGQFADRLGSQSPYLRARYNSPERRQEFLDNMVRFELLAIEAKKRGHDQRPEVQRVERQMMVQQMMKEMFDEQGVKLSDITDQEISAYYEAHKNEFSKPAQRRASHILRKDRASAQKVLDELKAQQGDMGLFRKLAKEKNQDEETKGRFGDLRFFSATVPAAAPAAKGEAPDEDEDTSMDQDVDHGEDEGVGPATTSASPPQAVRDAVFKLEKTGDLVPEVIQSEQGFHVVKLTGQREALERSLEDARRLIQNRLWRERREAAIDAFVSSLREKAHIEEDLSLLDQVKVDLDAAGPQEAQAEDLKKLQEPASAQTVGGKAKEAAAAAKSAVKPEASSADGAAAKEQAP